MSKNITLPVANNDLGRWMEESGASIEIYCTLGKYVATVRTKKLISYDDARGEHAEHRRVSRRHEDATEAIRQAVAAAMGAEVGS